MDPPEQSTKRKRTDESNTESSHEIVEGQPWYKDGNVILQTENTRFKVHRGVLSSRSVIFEDLFALGTADENLNPCPIVHLPDSAQDLRHFLKAIYDRRYFSSQGKTRPSFELVAAALRLGKKYQVEDLAEDAIIQLGFRAPTSFDLIRDSDDPANPFYDANKGMDDEWIHADYVEAVLLADEMNLQHLLPSLLLSLCIDDPTAGDDIEHEKRHSTFVNHNLEGWPRRDGKKVILPIEFVTKLLAGYNKLVHNNNNICSFGGQIARAGCDDKMRCKFIELRLLETDMMEILPDRLLRQETTVRRHFGFCDVCKPRANTALATSRSGIWAGLPRMFDMPPWSELLASPSSP